MVRLYGQTRKRVSYATLLRNAKAKKVYNDFVRQERKEKIETFVHGAKIVGSGVSFGAKSVGGFLGRKGASVKRLGLKGLWKKSIYD